MLNASQAVTESLKPPYNADGNPVFIWSQRRCSVPIRVFCPKCFAQLRVPSKMVGTNIDCVCCRHQFTVNEDSNTTPPAVVEPLLDDDRPLTPRRQRNMDFKWMALGTIVVFAVSLLLWIVFASLEAHADGNGNGKARRGFPPLPARVEQHNISSSRFVFDFTEVHIASFLRGIDAPIFPGNNKKFIIIEYSVQLKGKEGVVTGFAPLVLVDSKTGNKFIPAGWLYTTYFPFPTLGRNARFVSFPMRWILR